MSTTVSTETEKLARERGYTLNSPETPTFDELQNWLEQKGLMISIAPEPYATGVNWNWQVLWYMPKNSWTWEETEDDDGKPFRYPTHVFTGTGYYGDNGEYPTRHDALNAALQMGIRKINILYRNNSIDKLAKLYNVDNNQMLDLIRPHSAELGDWGFRELTEKQLDIIVSKIGNPPQQK